MVATTLVDLREHVEAPASADGECYVVCGRTGDRPASTTLPVLGDRGLFGSDTQSPRSIDPDDGTRSVVLGLAEHALSPRDGSLPVLPIALGLYRRHPDWTPSSLRVVDADDGWRITLVVARGAESSGLARGPITPEV